MKIEKIYIDGYKNIESINIEFEKITALVAVNNYGKSNVLEAIDFANMFIQDDSKEKMMSYKGAIPINKNLINKNFKFEIECSTVLEDKELKEVKEVYVQYGFEFSWARIVEKKVKEPKIINEYLKVKDNNKGQKYNMNINRNEEKAFFKPTKTARCDREIKIDNNELVLNKLKVLDDLFYSSIINEINNLKFQINSFFNIENAFGITPIKFKNRSEYELEDDGSNIAEIVNYLKNNEEKDYNLLIDIFKNIFKNIEDIQTIEIPIRVENKDFIPFPDDAPFNIVENIYKIMFKEKFNIKYMDFENLSTGAKRIFLFLTSLIITKKQKRDLIAFEELENCINPKLFEELISSVEKISDGCSLIISSHSPILINCLNISSIYIGEPSDDGIARFRRIKKSKYKTLENDARDDNGKVGDYLFNALRNYYDNREDDYLLSYLE